MSFYTTPPLPIIDWPADEKHMDRHSRVSYEFIILHATEGTDSRDWLATTSVPPVSAHRLIRRDGVIYKIVPDAYVAYTQGFSLLGGTGYRYTLNARSLSIELEHSGKQDYTNEQLVSCAYQVLEWRGIYGDLPLLYHRMIDPQKSDPVSFPREKFDRLLFSTLKSLWIS